MVRLWRLCLFLLPCEPLVCARAHARCFRMCHMHCAFYCVFFVHSIAQHFGFMRALAVRVRLPVILQTILIQIGYTHSWFLCVALHSLSLSRLIFRQWW